MGSDRIRLPISARSMTVGLGFASGFFFLSLALSPALSPPSSALSVSALSALSVLSFLSVLSDFFDSSSFFLFSSSLSGGTGEAVVRDSTTTYAPALVARSREDRSMPASDRPLLVEAVKYKYLPLGSKTGLAALLMPSVICVAVCEASE